MYIESMSNIDPKTCTCCNQTQELSFFYKDRTQRDGYRLRCKLCTKGAKPKKCSYCKATKKARDFTQKRSKGSQLLTLTDVEPLSSCLSAVHTQKTNMKICDSCSKDLQLSVFFPDTKQLDGYRPNCQSCERLLAAGESENPFISQFTSAQQAIHLTITDILNDHNKETDEDNIQP